MFTLTIHTDNDAFQPDPRPEIARILVSVAERIESGEDGNVTLYRVRGHSYAKEVWSCV